jgi:hypothetical protein
VRRLQRRKRAIGEWHGKAIFSEPPSTTSVRSEAIPNGAFWGVGGTDAARAQAATRCLARSRHARLPTVVKETFVKEVDAIAGNEPRNGATGWR